MAPTNSRLIRPLAWSAWVALTWGCAPLLASSQERHAPPRSEAPKTVRIGPSRQEAALALPRRLATIRSLDGKRLSVRLTPHVSGHTPAVGALRMRYALTPDFGPRTHSGCVTVEGTRATVSGLPPGARVYLRFEAEGVDGWALSPVYSAAGR